MPSIHRKIFNKALYEYADYLEEEHLINMTPLMKLKRDCVEWVQTKITYEIDKTKPGSISYLLWGETPSRHSIYNKMDTLGQFMVQQMIHYVPHLELIDCKTQLISGDETNTNKYIIWINHDIKKIYIRELKSNMELDTDNISETIHKINNIVKPDIETKYPEHSIDVGILNWTVYKRSILKDEVYNINKYEELSTKVYHMKDIIDLLQYDWSEEEFYILFRDLGKLCN